MTDMTYENHQINSFLANLAVFFYFIAMMVTTQLSGKIVSIFWYATLLFCSLVGIVLYYPRIKMGVLTFVFFMFVTGCLNIFLIGTSTVRVQLLLLIMFCSSLTMMTDYVSERAFLLVCLGNVFLVLFKYVTVGFYGQVYINSSTNYVSIYLMYPALLYFVLMEKREKKTPLWMAFLIWGLSLLARGRGGIIATTLLLMGMLFVDYLRSRNLKKNLILLIVVVTVIIAVLNLDSILTLINSSVITEYFRDRGMKSSRTIIWSDYINHTMIKTKYILFGTDMAHTIAGLEHANNPHNSFISIHVYNGLLMLLLVVIMLGKKLIASLMARQYVFTVCLISFIIRALTDNMFWPVYGTITLFFFLFFPFEREDRKRKIRFR